MSTNHLLRDHSVISPLQSKLLDKVVFGPTLNNTDSSSRDLSQFNELNARQKLKGEFELVSHGGASHEPVFNYVLRVGGSSYTGSGSNKKVAMNEAARAYFDGRESNSSVPTITKGIVNYIGRLQEICASNSSFPSPTYDFSQSPSGLKFTVVCRVGDFMSQGEHPTKKEAKRIASFNMINQIEEAKDKGKSPAAASSPQSPNISSTTSNKMDSLKQLEPLASEHKKKTGALKSRLDASGDLQNFLKENSLYELDTEKLVRDLSLLYGFQISFSCQSSPLDEKEKLCSALLDSAIIIVGTGVTESQAKAKASRNVLIYLKALLK